MLVFIDESGDPGFRFAQGSSRFFTIALVMFEDREVATACDQRIHRLRRELDWHSEFHFKRNPDYIRKEFIRAVSPYNCFYYGVVIDKVRQQHLTQQFPARDSFHQYACGLLFESAKEKLLNATVVIDDSGNKEFAWELTRYLKRKMNTGSIRRLASLKMQKSQSNNLIQLADYVAGIINRSIQKKKHGNFYRASLGHREIEVRVWPSVA